VSHTSKKSKGQNRMATARIPRLSKAELRLEEYRRRRSSASHSVKGTADQRQQEDDRVLNSFRKERLAANALIADER
jgi:hypothetical protein